MQIKPEVFYALEIALQEAFNAGGTNAVAELPKVMDPQGSRVIWRLMDGNLHGSASRPHHVSQADPGEFRQSRVALDGGVNGLGEAISIETSGGGIVTATYEECVLLGDDTSGTRSLTGSVRAATAGIASSTFRFSTTGSGRFFSSWQAARYHQGYSAFRRVILL
ncbi:hypothetical protein T190_11300 [Sinorhizobium meliloti CCBAU 01290]|nr:hypothetical protein T190_11300 [Sinorhizobium meliloti CCBAU 01290]